MAKAPATPRRVPGVLADGKHPAVNPLAGIRAIAPRGSENTCSPFTDAELKVILTPWSSRSGRRVPPSLVQFDLWSYSGTRVNEIAQIGASHPPQNTDGARRLAGDIEMAVGYHPWDGFGSPSCWDKLGNQLVGVMPTSPRF